MINKIELKDFRKFHHLTLEFHNKLVIFVGPNATGKTTILEAIYLISTTKSHRTTEYNAFFPPNKSLSEIQLYSYKKFKLIITKEGKTGFINDIFYSKTSEFIGQNPVILFSPTDIDLLQGAKSTRRRFLDLEISLLDKSYLRLSMTYKKLLKERNEILKQFSEDKNLILDVVTKQLIEIISKIYQKRLDFITNINKKLKMVCKKLNCEEITLEYRASYDPKNIYTSFLNKKNYDILSKTTNLGPHRDDFIVFIDQQEAKNYASEGQTRNAVLAIKFALMEIYKEQNQEIILLLDDVFASLDQNRINYILEYIQQKNQIFLTTTSIFNIPDELIRDSQIIKLQDIS